MNNNRQGAKDPQRQHVRDEGWESREARGMCTEGEAAAATLGPGSCVCQASVTEFIHEGCLPQFPHQHNSDLPPGREGALILLIDPGGFIVLVMRLLQRLL